MRSVIVGVVAEEVVTVVERRDVAKSLDAIVVRRLPATPDLLVLDAPFLELMAATVGVKRSFPPLRAAVPAAPSCSLGIVDFTRRFGRRLQPPLRPPPTILFGVESELEACDPPTCCGCWEAAVCSAINLKNVNYMLS